MHGAIRELRNTSLYFFPETVLQKSFWKSTRRNFYLKTHIANYYSGIKNTALLLFFMAVQRFIAINRIQDNNAHKHVYNQEKYTNYNNTYNKNNNNYYINQL